MIEFIKNFWIVPCFIDRANSKETGHTREQIELNFLSFLVRKNKYLFLAKFAFAAAIVTVVRVCEFLFDVYSKIRTFLAKRNNL